MKTKTLAQFITQEITNDVESGFAFMIGNSIEDDVKITLNNNDAKMQFYNKMVSRFENLQRMGKISNLVKNDDLSISFN